MKILNKIIEHVELQEASSAADICSNQELIASLAQKASTALKTSNDNVADMPMALVTQQVRSTIDGALIDNGTRLSKSNLEKVVTCVLDELKQNSSKYNLFEAKMSAASGKKSASDEGEDDDKKSSAALAKSLENDDSEEEDEDVKKAEKAEKEGGKKIADTSIKSDALKAAYDGLPKQMQSALDSIDVKTAQAARKEMQKLFPNITAEELKFVATIWRYDNT